MPVDEKRAQEVFLAAIELADSAQRAATIDRECGSDRQLKDRVLSLLATHRQSATVLDPLALSPFDPTAATMHGTMATDCEPGLTEPSVTASEQGHVADCAKVEDEDNHPLEFLEPSTKPESLGRLGHNEVLEVLGRGGFGIVVRAFDETLHRMVAIKVLSPQLASTSPARKRFLREARASAKVRHGNVVQIYAVEERPLPYLVMEYIPGETLQKRLDETGPLELTDVLRIGAQIARGLAAAHEQGLIHRDIKPANILLESGVDQTVKITDFGLARAADDASVSQSGVIAGTPMFMAPEQAKGEPPDPRADLFSLGSVLYAMASGRPPFRAATPLAVLKRVAEDTPRPIRQIIPEVPQWLCDLISRLHAKSPSDRFQSAAEVAGLLEQYMAHVQQPSIVARPDSVRLPRLRKSRRVALLGAATAILAGLSALAVYNQWRPAGSVAVTPMPAGSDHDSGPAAKPVGQPAREPARALVLQGRGAVHDALIDFTEPERSFGSSARDNAVRRADRCNAFLVRFDLAKLDLPPGSRVSKATVSFFVWDPSSQGKTKVSALPMKTGWDEVAATWREAEVGKPWHGQQGFAFGTDTGPPADSSVVVEPDNGSDTVDPPIEYQLDVTELVRSWLASRAPNHGLAIAPVIDASVDEGILTRFQVYASEHSQVKYTPKLTIEVQP
jgi:hypothetical protein